MNNKVTRLDYTQLSVASVVLSIVMMVIVGVLFFIESHIDKGVEE